jgi:hypothetical protein
MTKVADERLGAFMRFQHDITERVMRGSLDPEEVENALRSLIGQRSKKGILKLISGAETLMLDALDGKETLATAKEVFLSGIGHDFENWHTNKAGIATIEQAVDVHELIQNATFAQMFCSLGTDLDKLCLTQAQIKKFCKKHPQWLHQNGYMTFFLFKVEDQFFVARVDVFVGGLRVHINRFKDGHVWFAEFSHRLVVSQLTA